MLHALREVYLHAAGQRQGVCAAPLMAHAIMQRALREEDAHAENCQEMFAAPL